MSFWARLFGVREKQVTVPPVGGLIGALGGATGTGINVTDDRAMQASAVWACVQAISQDIAKVPPTLKRRLEDGSYQVVLNHPVARVLKRPNSWQTWNEFAQFMHVNKLLRGNAYALKVRSGGQLSALIPIRADHTTVCETADGEIYYQFTTSSRFIANMIGGHSVRAEARDVHHLRGVSRDGINGMSPIAYHREAIGLALATEQHGARLFGNGARPGGVLKSPKELSAEAAQRLRDSWQGAHGGVGNAHKTAVLEDGVEWQAIGMTSDDAQFLESRQFQVRDIGRIFRVPPHKIGDLSDATFSNIEEQSLEYVTDTLMPHFESFEAAMDRDLLRDPTLFIDHDVTRLLRGKVEMRYKAFATGRNWGWLSVNDIRRLEGMNPIGPDGDVYLQPSNMAPAGDAEIGGDDE